MFAWNSHVYRTSKLGLEKDFAGDNIPKQKSSFGCSRAGTIICANPMCFPLLVVVLDRYPPGETSISDLNCLPDRLWHNVSLFVYPKKSVLFSTFTTSCFLWDLISCRELNLTWTWPSWLFSRPFLVPHLCSINSPRIFDYTFSVWPA